MEISFGRVLWQNFLGSTPNWFKLILLLFLIVNPIVFFINPFIAGWLLVTEFIFTLIMALKCYPLLSGGLMAIEAVLIGMTNQEHVFNKLKENLEVLLLIMFMVASIHFIKQLLLFIFTRLLLGLQTKSTISLVFCLFVTFLSAFLDALTVVAVVITIAISFYGIYNQVTSHLSSDNYINRHHDRIILEQFCSFLRGLVMHAGVGTALGGMMTIVGEPQNVIIAQAANWNFNDFFLHVAPVSIPVCLLGLLTCWLVEKFSWFGYGINLPVQVRNILQEFYDNKYHKCTKQNQMQLITQSVIGIWLIIALALHLASVGLIGLSVIVLSATFTGITDEYTIAKAFIEVVPFIAVITVFFTVVAVIIDQHLFAPIVEYVLQSTPESQLSLFYIFNGLLSAISDNVFVGTIYINEAKTALEHGIISARQFELLAVAINTGTNLPSLATPNGQAAFLFLLTSTLAPSIRLSYGRMVWMALPYTIVLTMGGFLCIKVILIPATKWLTHLGILVGS